MEKKICADCGTEVRDGYYDQRGGYRWLGVESPMDTWCPIRRHLGHRVEED